MKRATVLLSTTLLLLMGSAHANPPEYVSPSVQTGEVIVIPPECDVEDWCLVKSTPCKRMFDSTPYGLHQTTVKYSVVRRAKVVCQGYYGPERRTITGPVEPIYFQSAIQAQLSEARSEAFDVCKRYREDWVSAAPSCK